jgi:hypothetical protein
MDRVNGVRKNAVILVISLVAGIAIWFQAASSPAVVAAFKSDFPIIVEEHPQFADLGSSLLAAPQAPAKVALADYSEIGSSSTSEILTVVQRDRLLDESMKYVAETPAEGIRIARSLNIVKDGGDPTNICGPLSIAILRDANVIDPYTKIRDFWLLNPDQNRRLLDQTFPPERFDHYTFTSPLNEMDWNTFPLKPGDFLYLYAGPGGTFEHMLAINRVDETGRAFAVTNYATPEGFLIGEAMLYDPAQPGTGKFFEWTNREENRFGKTGLGGFELWRLTQPVYEKSPREESFARNLDTVMSQHGGDWFVEVTNLSGGIIYTRQAGVSVDVGSMVKIPVAMLLFKSLESENIKAEDYGDYLSEEGPNRSYEQLLRAMFLHSETAAIHSLLKDVRDSGMDVENELMKWGLKNTNLDSGKSSVNDMVTLYKGLYSGTFVNRAARDYIMDLMGEATVGKESRLGVLQKTNPLSLEFYNRRGSTQDLVVAIGDSALVSVPAVDGDDKYIVVMLGHFSADSPTTDQELTNAIEEMAQVFWSYTRK